MRGRIIYVKGTRMSIGDLTFFLTDKFERRRMLKGTLDFYIREVNQ